MLHPKTSTIIHDKVPRHVFMKLFKLLILCLGLIAYTQASPDTPDLKKNFLIGNSLTWDTIPGLLADDTQWHVDCGVPLRHIYAKPDKPCVKTSTIWPKALKEKQYDQISIQPHYGATFSQDLETISNWVKLQPKATIIIHTGWAYHAERQQEYENHCGDKMQHTQQYFDNLLKELRERFPGRKFKRTLAMDILQQAHLDIVEGKSPLKDVAELYRDKIHMTHEGGRYLMHNAMRFALGQPRSAEGFEKTPPKLKTYLDSLLDRTLKCSP